MLAARCARREEAAWEELLRRAGPAAEAMMRRAFARAGLPEPAREAEEGMGEMAALLLRNDAALLRAYRPESSLRAYLAVIGRSVALEILRKRHPTSPLREPRPSVPAELEELPATPEQFRQAMARLQSRDRLLLKLVYWDARSYEEIARILKVAPNTIGPLLSRARVALEEILRKVCTESPPSP